MEIIIWKGQKTNEYRLDQLKEKRRLLNSVLERILREESIVKEVIERRT